MTGLPAGPQGVPVPHVVVVLDGWGLAEPGPGNAISLAHTPDIFDELWKSYPHTTLTVCGPAVGLPAGQMGNSEVGHRIGAGAIVKQDLLRLNEAVADGSMAQNPVLKLHSRTPSASTYSGLCPMGASIPRLSTCRLCSR